MVTQQPFKPSYYRPICQLAIPENYGWRQFPRESPSKLSEKSRMPLQVALRHTERVLFGPFWRSYTGQIYGRNPAPTPFRTVSEGVFSETGLQAYEVPESSSALASFLLLKGRLDSIGLHGLSLFGDY